MSEQDQDNFEKGPPNEFMPGEEEFDDEFESNEEAEGRAPVEPGKPSGRRFGFGFGRSADQEAAHPQGSVRGTHERVHIDDRASAIFVLVAALGLVAILLGSYVAGIVPAGAAPTLPDLQLQTYSAPPATPTPLTTPTPVSSASTSASASASATASPSTSPSASPSAS
jgi:hypothetical protein